MIGLLLASTLIVNAPECGRMALSGNTITISECGGGAPQPTPPPHSPTPTPKPIVTHTPKPPPAYTPRPGGTPPPPCANGMLTPFKDWISIRTGTIHSWCFDLKAPMDRLTVFTNDRSSPNLCAHLILTVIPPAESGKKTMTTGPGTTADETIRYFETMPVGRYEARVEGTPMQCANSAYRIEWTY